LETITLKEYEDHTVELSAPDAEFIEENLSGKISIRRPLQGKSHVLNPNQFVGLVPLPSGKLLERNNQKFQSEIFFICSLLPFSCHLSG
jgi:hypothetical protein